MEKLHIINDSKLLRSPIRRYGKNLVKPRRCRKRLQLMGKHIIIRRPMHSKRPHKCKKGPLHNNV